MIYAKGAKELEEGVTDRDIYADRYTAPDRY